MRKQAAKGRSLLSLAALLSLIAAVLVAPSASASRYLLDLLPVPPTTPSVEQPQAAGQPPPTFALLTAQERLALDPDAHPEQVTVRWRRSYLPGASGLDDAVQVRIEEAASGSDTLYTLLRDELGSVIGLIEEPVALEDEELPAIPPLVARYLYTPFGEARVETALELASARLDPDRTMVEVDGAPVAQAIDDPQLAASGALLVRLSAPPSLEALAGSISIRAPPLPALEPGTEVVATTDPLDPALVVILPLQGWQRGLTYHVELSTALSDTLGRRLHAPLTLSFAVPSDELPIIYQHTPDIRFDSVRAASDTLDGRFPGGQPTLFQGLWTDPVTGIAYARARWYDPRNATWLSEDPARDADSPNLYAFVGWRPHMHTDPRGEALDTAIDGAQLAWDTGKLFYQLATKGEVDDEVIVDVAMDVAGFLLPGVTAMTMKSMGRLAVSGMRAATRVAARIDDIVDAARGAERLADGADGLADANRYLSRLTRRATNALESATDASKLRRGAGSRRAAQHAGDRPPRRPSQADNLSDAGPLCRLPFGAARCFTGDTEVVTPDGAVPLRDLEVGDRVLTGRDSFVGATAVDDSSWRVVTLLVAGDSLLEPLLVRLLRPPDWLALNGVVAGGTMDLTLPEMGVAGVAEVLAVEPCPPIAPGPGRVITATLATYSDRLVELSLDILDEPLLTTAEHPLYSLSRHSWVPASHFLPGEQLWTLKGPATLRSRAPLEIALPVHNIEVEHDHLYLVTPAGLLSHNTTAGSTGCGSAPGGGAGIGPRVASNDMLAEPGRLQAKLAAWRRYMADPNNAGWGMARWSRNYDQLAANRIRGKNLEAIYHRLGLGSPGSRLTTGHGLGARIPDAVDGMVLREIKSSRITLTRDVRMQILKDVMLRRRGFLPEWHLHGGASQSVIDMLNRWNIPYYLK